MSDPRTSAQHDDLLTEWLAGDLAAGSDEEAALLVASAAEPALAAEMEAHRALRARVRELAAVVDPARDLWPQIAARVDGEQIAGAPHPPWWRRTVPLPGWTALAAALALAVGAGLFLASRQGPPDTPLSAAAPWPSEPWPSPPPALAAYAETDRELAAIRDELYRTIAQRQERLPAETRELVFENLRTIDRAITEIEAALAASPGDGELARTYISYRERQIALLRQANQLAARL